MTNVNASVWERLSSSPPRGEAVTARLALPDTTDRLFAGIDSLGRRHWLILSDGTGGMRETGTRGLRVSLREMVLNDRTASYIDVECEEPSGHAAFDLIGAEIGGLLSDAPDSIEAVSKVIAKWRRFWSDLPVDRLSDEAVLGLFGELCFLKDWLVPAIGIAKAAERWRGPFGSRHDFEWQQRSVEIKACTSARGHIYQVNGLEQLEPPEEGRLFLFGLVLRKEAGATLTLPVVVDQILSLTADDAHSTSLIETGLQRRGYSMAHKAEYDELRLRIADSSLFQVIDGFPRLTPRALIGVPLGGIERVVYEINLNAFEEFVVAKTPAESGALL